MRREDAKPKILLVGGGTGGHITPLLAVAQEIKKLNPAAEVYYAAEHGSRFTDLIRSSAHINGRYFVRAGKLRRYHGQSWFDRLVDLKTNLLNARDALMTLVGIVQASRLLARLKPDVVFIKGGFVGVPLGIAARIRQIPFITHDSDILPGLANRLIGRWARWHVTGMPPEFYDYPPRKVRYLGIPVSSNFQPVNEAARSRLRREIGLGKNVRLILITGGSQGAKNLNRLVDRPIKNLLSQDDGLCVVHQTGEPAGKSLVPSQPRLITKEFLPDLYKYSGAADLIISRAGATSIAEFALQGKACILVPHAQLAGGHQLKNAEYLRKAGAAVVLTEEALRADASLLETKIANILNDTAYRRKLETNIARLSKPRAAHHIARLVIDPEAPDENS